MPHFSPFSNLFRKALCLCFCLPVYVFATHNLAGEVTLEHISGTRYRITLVTYTDPAPAGVDRCSADLEVWTSQGGDSELLEVLRLIGRTNGPIDNDPPSDCELPSSSFLRDGENISQAIKRNVYIIEYEFPSIGEYEIRYFDIARREDIMNLPNPGETSFFVSTHLRLTSDLGEINNSPLLLNEPIESTCTGSMWVHNPGVFDLDGDSLAFQLIAPREYDSNLGLPVRDVPNYQFPDDPAFQANNTMPSDLLMDPVTGLISWESPSAAGVYALAYQIEEYRNGVFMGSVSREMVIIVRNCENAPPQFQLPEEIISYLTAGNTWELKFNVWDPDGSDSLYFELNHGFRGNNGPFSPEVSSLAEISASRFSDSAILQTLPYIAQNQLQRAPDTLLMIDTLQVSLTWTPTCEDIRTQPYQIDLNAYDNYSYRVSPNSIQTYNQRALSLFVLPPPPTDLALDSTYEDNRQTRLVWQPATCTQIIGYRVYYLSQDANDTPRLLAEIEDREIAEVIIETPTEEGLFSIASIAVQDAPIWDREIEGVLGVPITSSSLVVSSLKDLHSSIRIFPNPTSGVVTVELEEQTSAYQLRILDIQGRVLELQHTFITPLSEVSLQNYPQGMYFLEIWDNKERIHQQKIVKL